MVFIAGLGSMSIRLEDGERSRTAMMGNGAPTGNRGGDCAGAPSQSGYRSARSVIPGRARPLTCIPLALGFPELSIFTRSLINEYTPKFTNYTDVVIFGAGI
jgi:hypothetical protein